VQVTLLTTVGATLVGAVAVVGTITAIAMSPSAADDSLWDDGPLSQSTVLAGELPVTVHSNEPNLTAIRAVIQRAGKDVETLTDTDLEVISRGQNAKRLYMFEQSWTAVPGTYTLTATAYSGSAAQSTASVSFVVVGSLTTPDPTPSPEAPTPSDGPSVSPSPSASPSLTPSAEPTSQPEPTTKPTTKPTTRPSPEPEPTETEPPVETPEPVVPPAPGKATRSNESNQGWTNTFTVTGVRPKSAQVYVEINLHNTVSAPYYNGWQTYPCGTLTLDSGSGADATYRCTVNITIEPPGNWRSGEFWRAMPASTFRPKVVVNGKTYYGIGGNWSVPPRAV
jgi:hypothetical protein